ncbi:MAG: c-type cytochrome [Acidobacteriota bacterium]
MNWEKGYFDRLWELLKLSIAIIFFSVLVFSYSTTRADSNLESQDTKSTNLKNVALGLNHFDAHCASCHGKDGKAQTEKGRSVKAADLTSHHVQSESDAELFRVIHDGVKGTAMPAFGKTHSATEINHIILFLRKLPTLTSEERKQLEAAIPPDARHHHPPASDHDTQTQTQKNHRDHQSTPAPGQDTRNSDNHSADHNEMNHDMNAMMTTPTGGPFKSMTAIGSGTSLLPASAPGYMWHWMAGDWMLMAHGDLKIGFNHQGGRRGVNKAESQNWFMLMAERQAGKGQLMLRGMFSAETWTAPRRGFPELFQTGETFDGRPLIDAQHPHDLFMELAAQYTLPLTEKVSLNIYGGPVGEPALGPVAFMHRGSASEMPSAPLGHHWQDSTHITHGVVTLGLTLWRFKVEGSVFRGKEPDENRKDIELGKLDSWSGRVWFTPTQNWTMQFSHGRLHNPEALEPGDLKRTTASISYNRPWSDGHWASSLIWGRNAEVHGDSNTYLVESTVNFLDKNYLFTRLELADKNGLLQDNIFGRPGLVSAKNLDDIEQGHLDPLDELRERWFRVGAFTFGGVRDVFASSKLRVGIGANLTLYHVPDGLKPIYGSSPKSYQIFVRFRPGKMSH